MFVHEVGIINKHWLDMADGNPVLASDLEKLYREMQIDNQEYAQHKLDAFCKSWNLEVIKISK